MTYSVQIGSGRPLFILPGGKFINATAPLKLAAQSSPPQPTHILSRSMRKVA